MNISEAKEQIKNAMTAYFKKDEFGAYRMSRERQRPIFLLGAPGIGKTAIMEQIAGELGVGLVSYSMIHHTRQSALGLPYIVKKNYGGKEVAVSEYTMSEIIASVYDLMADTGVTEGILFLDEVNCVSETLAPAMLQFLQFKTFGRHALPEGWLVVTAGNPPEYNKSVRSFDVVTLDRLKKIEVEPDFDAWKDYAYEHKVHPAVMTYLAVKKNDFCRVETTVAGKSFVTPRGWDDLSEMMKEYEADNIKVNEALIGQYLQNDVVAKDFAVYYDLYKKYKSDYQIDDILNGNFDDEVKRRAADAPFDERLSLINLLLAAINGEIEAASEKERVMRRYFQSLQQVKNEVAQGATVVAAVSRESEGLAKALAASRLSFAATAKERRVNQRVLAALTKSRDEALDADGNEDARFAAMKTGFDGDVTALGDVVITAKDRLDHLFNFAEDVFGDGKEMLVLVTELTANKETVNFISRYGCDAYFAHNKELLFYEKEQEIDDALAELEL